MGGLVEVLAAHVLRDVDPACSCGWDWDYREVVLPSEVDFDPGRYRLPSDVRPEQHRTHVATAVLAWVDARLGEAREGVAEALYVEERDTLPVGAPAMPEWDGADDSARMWWRHNADAALGVVRGVLGADSVVLVGEEVLRARTAVRKYLQKVRGNYRNSVRRGRREHYAKTELARFDAYLELYELLGGDPDEIRDPEEAPR